MNKWMSRLPENRLYILTNFACTHDSSAFYMGCLLRRCSQAQKLNYSQQLNIGVRHFDIRIVKSSSDTSKDEDVTTCHGICDCYHSNNCCDCRKLTLKEILLTIKAFLLENPSEAVYINLQSGRGNALANMARGIEIFYKYCGDITLDFDKKLRIGDIRGKIICSPNLDNDKLTQLKCKRIPKKLANTTGIENVHKHYGTYQTFKVDGNLKIEEVSIMMDKYKQTIEDAEKIENQNVSLGEQQFIYPIQYSVSCTGEFQNVLPYPKGQSNIVNKYLIEKDLIKGHYYGWINFDFINAKIAKKLIETNFI